MTFSILLSVLLIFLRFIILISLTLFRHFITEKKPTLPLDSVVQKLTDSYRSCIAPGELLLAEKIGARGQLFEINDVVS